MNEMNSQRLKSLSEDDTFNALVDLWSEIKILSGAILYDKESAELQIQLDVLCRFVRTHPSFNSLTVSEIRHAFYLNNQGEYAEVYKHWNKELNAEYVGCVLVAYVKRKKELYSKHGQDILKAIVPPAAKSEVKPITIEEVKAIIQQHYTMYLSGSLEHIYTHDCTYHLLRRLGGIVVTSRQKYYKWIAVVMAERIKWANASEIKKGYSEIDEMRRIRAMYKDYGSIHWPGVSRDEFSLLRHMVRKRLYLHFFKIISDCNIKDIFNEIHFD